MDRFQYLLLMAGCVVITLPLEFIFGARVWRRPRRLAAALGIPLAVLVLWDYVAIEREHWYYNPDYVTGWKIGSVPIEELVFFLVIPICGLLTLEAVRRVLAFLRND